MDSPRPPALLAAALEIAQEAGDLLASRFRSRAAEGLVVRGERDPVTAADRDADALISRRIRERFPDHAILSEEGGPGSRVQGPGSTSAPVRWIVDPLDGTVNFLHGHPMYAVSIGIEVAGRIVAGVVHAPTLRETFAAAAGVGATLDGGAIRVSATADLGSGLLATGFPYERARLRQNNLDNFGRLALAARGVRRNGAASLDLAYVAAGIFDGFWEYWLQPWDVAAGALLVREAGGNVTDAAGGETWLHARNVIASNGRLHAALRALLPPLAPEAAAPGNRAGPVL